MRKNNKLVSLSKEVKEWRDKFYKEWLEDE